MMTPDQLIDFVAVHESGGDYAAWTADDNGHGPSFGLIQFNAGVGTLPELLKRMHDADPVLFESVFGRWTSDMLDESDVRAMREGNYSTKQWSDIEDRFTRAGSAPKFQQVQRDLAKEEYLDPAWAICQDVSITTERALALAFDAAVQRGVGWTRTQLKRLSGPLRPPGATTWDVLSEFCKLADKGLGGATLGRRHRILRDPNLSNDPWSPEPAAPPEYRPMLHPGDRHGAVVELRWLLGTADLYDSATIAAVMAFQKKNGLKQDGIVGPLTWNALENQ